MEKKKKPVRVKIIEENEYAVIEPEEEVKEEEKEQKTLEIEMKPEIEEKPPKEIKIKVPEKIEEGKIKSEKLPEKKEKEIKTKEEELEERIKSAPIDMIETDIDRLYKLLTENWTPMTNLAEKLKVNIDRVENWAKILEERGLAEIDYPIIGIPRVRKKVWKKKKS